VPRANNLEHFFAIVKAVSSIQLGYRTGLLSPGVAIIFNAIKTPNNPSSGFAKNSPYGPHINSWGHEKLIFPRDIVNSVAFWRSYESC
jgi:hypothetical protein